MTSQLTPNFDNGMPTGVARMLALAERRLMHLSNQIKCSEADRDGFKATADQAALEHESLLTEVFEIQAWINCTKHDYKIKQ